MLLFAVYLASHLPYPGWLYWVFFLAPDVGFMGYLFNPRVGAVTYNILHHKGIALIVYLAGAFIGLHVLQFVGLVLFGHSSFDRMFGYGLKFQDSFHNTHLGPIGRQK